MRLGPARGTLTAVHTVGWLLYTGLWIALAAFGRQSVQAAHPLLFLFAWLWLGSLVLQLGTGLALFIATSRLKRDVHGRSRLRVLSAAAIIHCLITAGGWISTTILIRTGYLEFLADPTFASLPLADLEFFLPREVLISLYVFSGLFLLSLLIILSACISAWFLIPRVTRLVLWIVFDVLIAAAFIFVTWTLPIRPPSETPQAIASAAIRVGITVVFCARLFVWLMPGLLSMYGRLGFHAMVAARHLRAKKSGFLTIIGILAIGAVSVSSCALSTALSVMGGFRHDLRDKIIGNTAHIVIDRQQGKIEGWASILESVRNAEGVVGATPILQGEVMVTSASNLGGAVLRGIDVESIGEVSVLSENMEHGGFHYLTSPERLLEVPVEERGSATSTLPPAPPRRQERSSLMQEIDRAIEEAVQDRSLRLDEEPTHSPPPFEPLDPLDTRDIDEFLDEPEPMRPARRVLPGIIVGRELARSLRLYVGDEVSVVSPFGDLGPTGPMPKSRPFRVAGIFYSGMYEYDMKHAYITLDTAQRFLNTGDAISSIEARVDQMDDSSTIAGALRTRLAEYELRVRDWQELNRSLFGALNLEKLLMFFTLGLALLVAGFCIFGTMILMVQEKTKEVGVLKALGASNRAIVNIFTMEGVLIGVCGAALGLGLGYVACFIAEWGVVRISPEVFYIDRVPVHIDPLEFAAVGAAAAMISLLAVVIPAFLAGFTRPVDALRFD